MSGLNPINDPGRDTSPSSSFGTFINPGTEAKISALVKDTLDLVPFSPQLLIDALKLHPRLELLYEQECPYPMGYQNDLHAHAVLTQFDKYFAPQWRDSPSGFTLSDMRLTLALHDIGKFLAAPGEGQHSYTIGVIDSVRSILPMSDASSQIMKAIIDGDPIGSYFKSFTKVKESPQHVLYGAAILPDKLKEYEALTVYHGSEEERLLVAKDAATMIAGSALDAGIPYEEFSALLIQYFQSDSSSYSIDAELGAGERGHAGLESMYEHISVPPTQPRDTFFVYDKGKGRLSFSPETESLFQKLEALL